MFKRLGEVLVDQGVLDKQTLQQALAAAAVSGRRIGEFLIEKGFCTEQAIRTALAKQLGLDEVSLEQLGAIPPEVLSLIPDELAIVHQILPLRIDENSGFLEIAMADPADQDLLDELRFRTGHDIRPLVALPSELSLSIERYYRYPSGAEAVQRSKSREMEFAGDARNRPESQEILNLRLQIQNLQNQLTVQSEAIHEMWVSQRILIQLLTEAGQFDREKWSRLVEQELRPNL